MPSECLKCGGSPTRDYAYGCDHVTAEEAAAEAARLGMEAAVAAAEGIAEAQLPEPSLFHQPCKACGRATPLNHFKAGKCPACRPVPGPHGCTHSGEWVRYAYLRGAWVPLAWVEDHEPQTARAFGPAAVRSVCADCLEWVDHEDGLGLPTITDLEAYDREAMRAARESGERVGIRYAPAPTMLGATLGPAGVAMGVVTRWLPDAIERLRTCQHTGKRSIVDGIVSCCDCGARL